MSARRDASGPAGIVVPILRRPGRGPSLALEDGDDIAVGAALGVACGLVFWLFNFAYA